MTYTTSERASIATTIANQLTRSEKGIRVLAMMIGAKNFISLDAGSQFQFAKFSGCKATYCCIEYSLMIPTACGYTPSGPRP